jgi:hypothetical protein
MILNNNVYVLIKSDDFYPFSAGNQRKNDVLQSGWKTP